MHDIKKPRGYKPPRARRKPKLFIELSNGKRVPTFAVMVALLQRDIAKV